MTNKKPFPGNGHCARRNLFKAMFETLESRRMLDALTGAENLDTLTAIQPAGSIITTDPALYGPTQFIAGGRPIDELLQPDGKRLVAGTMGGNVALARYSTNGSLDSSFGTAGVVTTDLGSS